MKTLVSVVVPTFNGAAFVRAAIESVLAQAHSHVELLVCDDGSKDDSVEILRGFGDRIRLFQQPNAGVSAARNRCLAHARGELVAFLDQDDLWEPDYLSTQVPLLLAHPEWSFVYADSLIIDRTGAVHGRRGEYLTYREGQVFAALLRGNFVPIETLLMRTALCRSLEGFRTDLRYLEDWELCLRAARVGPVGFTARALARYRVHDRNLSRDIDAIVREYASVLAELVAGKGAERGLELAASEGSIARAELLRRRTDLAWMALRRVDLVEADRWLADLPRQGRTSLRALRVLRALLDWIPAPLFRRALGLLPARRLYGLRPAARPAQREH